MSESDGGTNISYYFKFIFSALAWGGVLFFAVLFLLIFMCNLKKAHYPSSKLVRYIQTLKMTVRMYLQSWPALILCAIISLVASAAVILGIVFIASIFPFAPHPRISAMAGILGNVFSAIPVIPGGLGVGEVVFAKICTDLCGMMAPYASIYLTFRIGMLFANIPGAFFLMFWKKKRSDQIGLKEIKLT